MQVLDQVTEYLHDDAVSSRKDPLIVDPENDCAMKAKPKRLKRYINKRKPREEDSLFPSIRESSSDLNAVIIKVEFRKSKLVHFSSSWSKNFIRHEIASQFRSGCFPVKPMQNQYDEIGDEYVVSVVEELNLFKDSPTSISCARGRSVNEIEAVLERRVYQLRNTFVKSKLQKMVLSYRRRQLQPGLSLLKELSKCLRSEEQTAAVLEIQRCVRGRICRIFLIRNRRNLAQVKLAAFFRRMLVQPRVIRIRDQVTREEATAMIQQFYRWMKIRQALTEVILAQVREKASRTIQKAFRNFISFRIGRASLAHQRKSIAAIKIQKLAVSFLFKILLIRRALMKKGRFEAAVTIQKHCRRVLAINKTEDRRRAKVLQAAVVIQSSWRSYKGHLAFQMIRFEKNRCAKSIQRFYHSVSLRIRVRQRRRLDSTLLVQRIYRRKQRHRIVCAAQIQRTWRKSHLESRQYKGAVALQQLWRAYVGRARVRARKRRVLLVQCSVRYWLAQRRKVVAMRKKARLEGMPVCDECGDQVCQVLCHACRGKFCEKCMKIIHTILKDHQLKHRVNRDVIYRVQWDRSHVEASKVVQRGWRISEAKKLLALKKEQHQKQLTFLKTTRSKWRNNVLKAHKATDVNRIARGFLARKWLKQDQNNVVVLQRWGQMMILKLRFIHCKIMCVRIQALIRMVLYRNRYLKYRKSVIVLQSRARMQLDKEDYNFVRGGIISLQAIHRRNIRHTNYVFQRRSAIIIQKNMRGYVTRAVCSHRKCSAIRVQTFYRSKAGLHAFKTNKHAALLLQRRFRIRYAQNIRYRLVRHQQKYQSLLFSTKHKSASKIQRAFRQWFALKQAALRIQRVWRRKQGAYSAFLVKVARRDVAQDRYGLYCAWQCHFDPYNQTKFFFNTVTLERCILKPSAYAIAEYELNERQSMLYEDELMKCIGEAEARKQEESDAYHRMNAPENWLIHYDTEGNKYYSNAELGESTWERPCVLGIDPDLPLWETHMHPVTETPYYVHRESGESTWLRPVEVLGYEFKEYWDFEKSRPYWVSSVNGHIEWEPPEELKGKIATEESNEEWQEAVDEETGNPYYFLYNLVTGETRNLTWDRPLEIRGEWEKWDEFWSDTEKQPYFVNKISGESSWKKPW